MKSKIDSLVDLVNELLEKDTYEKISYNDLSSVSDSDKDFPEVNFWGDEENDSGEMILVRCIWGKSLHLPSLSEIEFQSEVSDIFDIFLRDYDEVLEKESEGEEITEWQVYYKEMFERMFSVKELELLRSKYGKK